MLYEEVKEIPGQNHIADWHRGRCTVSVVIL